MLSRKIHGGHVLNHVGYKVSTLPFPLPTSGSAASKLHTDPLVISVAAVIFSAGFWAICGPALITISPIVAIGLGGMHVICLGSYIIQHKKEIIYEISLLMIISLNALFPNTYHWWNKIDEGLYLGAIPLEQHIDLLQKELPGPIAILSLVEPFELADQYLLTRAASHAEWKRRGIPTKQIPAIDFTAVSQDHLDEAVQFIHEMRKQGRTVYVHCKAGVGRSASVISAFLLEWGLASGKTFASVDSVIQFIKAKRPHVVIDKNPSRAAIHEFYQRVNSKL
jgi:atypical dual specificity phosphatase